MSSLTAHGFPYPDGDDSLRDYPAVAQALAELLEDRVTAKLWDSSAITFPVASITTPALDQSFDTLYVIGAARGNSGNARDAIRLRFNGDAGAGNYLWQTGSPVSDDNYRAGYAFASGVTDAHLFARFSHRIYRYADAAQWRMIRGEFNGDGTTYENANQVFGGYWKNAADPITSLTLSAVAGQFVAGSWFAVYGEGH